MCPIGALGVRIAGLQWAHDHFAGVHPNANFYRHSAALKKLVAITANLLLYTESRMNCTLRMVFVCYRSAE